MLRELLRKRGAVSLISRWWKAVNVRKRIFQMRVSGTASQSPRIRLLTRTPRAQHAAQFTIAAAYIQRAWRCYSARVELAVRREEKVGSRRARTHAHTHLHTHAWQLQRELWDVLKAWRCGPFWREVVRMSRQRDRAARAIQVGWREAKQAREWKRV